MLRTGRAAPRGLARLLLVLGLLVGLAALQGMHNRDRFQPVAQVAMCQTVDVAADGTITFDHTLLDQSDPAGHSPVGVIGMCVTLLVSVLLLMFGLTRLRLLGVAPLRAGPPRLFKRRGVPAPSLAMICVLRT